MKERAMTPKHSDTERDEARVDRRLVLATAGAALALGPTLSLAANFDGMEDEIARRARDLAAGREVALRLTIPEGSGANVEPIIAAFTERTGIEIKVEKTHVDDINTHLILDAISGNDSFDVALPATFGLPDLVAAQAIQPLNRFAARHEPPGFRNGILYSTGDIFDGEIYGFQTDGDTYLMFYNTDFLDNPAEQAKYADKTGEALAIPQTWAQLDRQIAFFHRPDENMYGGALFRLPGYLGWEWWVRFHAKGLVPFTGEMVPQIAGEEGQAALEEMIAVTQYLTPDVRTVGLFANWETFAKGNVYCNIGWGGTQKYLNGPKSEIRGKLAHGPTPGGMVNGKRIGAPYFNWGWDYVVSRQSKEAEIAYLFCLFAASPAISTQSIGQRDGFFDPFRTEHYDDPKIRKLYGEAFLKVHRESLETSIPDLYLANQSEYFLILNEWIDLALSGEIKPLDALRRIEVEWELITYRAGKETQTERWQRLLRKYPKIK